MQWLLCIVQAQELLVDIKRFFERRQWYVNRSDGVQLALNSVLHPQRDSSAQEPWYRMTPAAETLDIKHPTAASTRVPASPPDPAGLSAEGLPRHGLFRPPCVQVRG